MLVRYETMQNDVILELDTHDVSGILEASKEHIHFDGIYEGNWVYATHLLNFYYEKGVLKQYLSIFVVRA